MRRRSILAAALALVLALSACGGASVEETAAPGGAGGAVTVNYGTSNPWDALMPYYSVSGSNYARIIYDKIYDRLAYVQPAGTCLLYPSERISR